MGEFTGAQAGVAISANVSGSHSPTRLVRRSFRPARLALRLLQSDLKTAAGKIFPEPRDSVWSPDPRSLHLLHPLPNGVRVAASPSEAGTVILFVEDLTELHHLLSSYEPQFEGRRVWVAYRKSWRDGLGRESLWGLLAEFELRPVGYVTIDERWSALRVRPVREPEERVPTGSE